NMASGQVAISTGARGPSYAAVSACASAGHAIGEAFEAILRGDAEMMLAGGSETPVHETTVGGFSAMRALSTRNDDPAGSSRPFDAGRDGFVFSEGAVVMILETEEHAARRGAAVICQASGGAYTSDAFHITAPDPSGSGAARAMSRALTRAELAPSDVQYVAAHATATPIGDIAETTAIKQAFGDHAPRLAISATKSMVGHLLGAAGGISSLACVYAIRDGIVPPTINLDDPDPACDLDYVANVARKLTVDAAAANGFGFGGQNACAIFRRI
ncbi:MAG: beta-ketoacyl-[acyl-carrier-protein] synthase II, partial [Chloroflexota bacterium]|nr:beta-ketoacyl-[acyl-carrier-protein] synthase II [Chloroflexota bacterium]